jgi:SAM-dependent methyltransferase
MVPVTVSEMDIQHLAAIRANIVDFMRRCAQTYGRPGRLLDIAPQDHEGARPYFPPSVTVETLDINPQAGCTYVGDICRRNDIIPSGRFDFIVCTEVLEHVLQPFEAAKELWRLLSPGGLLFVTTPYNFRIHGPLPDCWRFTEHGLRALFGDFELLELSGLETAGRDLMPIQYTTVARKSD